MLKGFDLAIDSIAGSFIITDVYGFPSLKGFDLAIDERLYGVESRETCRFHPSKRVGA